MKLTGATGYTLTSGGVTMKFGAGPNGDTGVTTFDTFTYDSSLDVYTADHCAVVIQFTSSTAFSAVTGVAPNQRAWSGTYSHP